MTPILLALLTLAHPPLIEVAHAERTGVREARLTLLQADPRLFALCLDEAGLGPEAIERARSEALGRPVWLYQGSRRVARGRLHTLSTGPSAAGPCAVVAEAEFDAAVPLTASTELLWASERDWGSRPRAGVTPKSVERARSGLPEELAQACARPLASLSRATRGATFVNLVCPVDSGTLSILLAVPATGRPRLLLADTGEEGRLSLLEAIETSPGSATLALARDTGGVRTLELWSSDAQTAGPLPTWRH